MGPSTGAAEIPNQWDEARIAAQSEIAALRARLAQASISQQEVAFLQEQLALKAREVVGLQTRLTEAQAVADALREQIASGIGNVRELGTMQARVAAQASEIARLKAEVAEAQALATVDTGMLRAQDQIDRKAVSRLQAQLADRAALVEALETQLAEKARAVAELRTHMADVESSLQNLERQFSYKTQEIENLQRSLGEARTQAQRRIATLESSARDGADVDRVRMAALEAELAEKSAAVNLLEEQLRNAQVTMSALEKQLSATNVAVDAAIAGARQVDSHDEVIASIAQELRTPMSSIMGYTDLLLRESIGILGSLQRKFLQRVKANTERMGALLDDLIRITALDTGRLTLEPEKIDVIYAVEEAVMNVGNQYREKGLVMRLALADGLPPLTADRDALLQMIGHLLSNAALASPVEGEVQLMATARREVLPVNGANSEVDCLYLAVTDSGSGIAQEDWDRVFARKYRADNPLIEGLGDTGVSLSLARR
jgi:signal transduction histidine kinase